MDNSKIAALYIRVSTEEQARHGYSLDAQEEALERYCKENNLIIAKKYIDDGVSGKLPIAKRPQLMRMLEDIPHLNIEKVLFVKLDRFFRSVAEYYKAMEVLDKYRVTWRAILEDYATDTADGRLKVNIMLSVAQNEAERTSERIKFVNEAKVRRGEIICGSVPFGYKIQTDGDGKKRAVKDPETEAAVNDMFEYMLRVRSALQTANYMNEKYPQHSHWRCNWVRIIKKPEYCGRYRDTPDYFPPYITPGQHAQIVSDMQKNMKWFGRKAKGSHIYIFTGLIRCPECGHPLSAMLRRDSCKRVHYIYYRCHQHVDRRCGYSRTIPEFRMEEALLMHVRRFAAEQLHSLEAQPKKKPAPKVDKTKLTARLKRLTNAYVMGNLDEEEYVKMSTGIKRQLAVPDIPQPRDEAKRLREIMEMDLEASYKGLTDERKREFWRSIIKEIHLDENKQPKYIIFA